MMDNLITKAREVALAALKDETRYDGVPFIEHPDNVAKIVEDEIGLPEACVAAVYLHEATRVHRDIDIGAFPADVLELTEGLNRISTIKPKDTRLEAENYKRLIVQYSTDPRAVVIKIADRLEVMRRLGMFPKGSRDQKLLETMMLYMPLAHQLGLYNINNELGNICLRHTDPEQYRTITNKLKATEKDRERLTAEFIRPLEKKLSEAGILYDPESGRRLRIMTTQPSIHIYAGNFLKGCPRSISGHEYDNRAGVAIECQAYPNSPNCANFPSTVLRPGELYNEKIVFRFETDTH